MGIQGGGSSPAKVNGLQGQAQIPGNPAEFPDFPAELFDIRADQLPHPFHLLRNKGAVAAPLRAEGNRHIEAETVREAPIVNRLLRPANLLRE